MRARAPPLSKPRWDRRSLLGGPQTLPVSTAKPANRAAIAHETSGPFWISHCSMAKVSPCGGKSDRSDCARGAAFARQSFAFRGHFYGDAKLRGSGRVSLP